MRVTRISGHDGVLHLGQPRLLACWLKGSSRFLNLGELPDARQRGRGFDLRVGLGMLTQLAVDPVDQRHYTVDDR
jgi:hypothetical protein